MCDTVVALGNSTKDGRTLFGKNSDRLPNEAQPIRYYPRKSYDDGEMVECTYIKIPQVRETYAVFLSQPYWIWGAEMGANEYGVAIGNEAVWSNEEVPETGLLGMDLLRLGLERGQTATEALEVITSLLEEHGQGGAGEHGALAYHNSFLIADKDSAWVLETSSRRWVAEKVNNIRAISNGYTIGSNWDRGSPDIVEHALSEGWCKTEEGFSFAQVYENPFMRQMGRCDDRYQASTKLLEDHKGSNDFHTIASILRNHPADWTPWEDETAPICRHANHKDIRATTGSQISEIGEKTMHWFTGSSNPCMSVYWPFSFEDPFVYLGFDKGGEKFSTNSYWWSREPINRNITHRFIQVHGEVNTKIQNIQTEVRKITHDSMNYREIEKLIQEHQEILQKIIDDNPMQDNLDADYVEYWRDQNNQVGI
jgi:dipeptidase